jgi:hypothetical protein
MLEDALQADDDGEHGRRREEELGVAPISTGSRSFREVDEGDVAVQFPRSGELEAKYHGCGRRSMAGKLSTSRAGNDGDACTHGRSERACGERQCCHLEEKTRERKERGPERGVAVLRGSR